MNSNIVPRDKEDLNFIEFLFSMNINEVKNEVPLLLEWIQDGNWPQAPYICKYFIPYVNDIEYDIVKILRGDDEMWKYWLINGLLYKSKYKLSKFIIEELENLYNSPSEDEKEAGVDISALEVIKKFGNGLN